MYHHAKASFSQYRKTIEAIDEQITHYQSMIDRLIATKAMLIDEPKGDVYLFHENTKLTKDIIRAFMKQARRPMRTVEVIDALYPRATEEMKNKAIKTLSVIFNTLEKDKQIKVEKQEGVKGNFYSWIG
ncbi:hypothetical protein [Paraflavitalea speifideaquila]|uniref:hypothetical protein n=1 Tax=Paraflavitalea speifideaquila TaxID=3076558 RepID=UPI0028EFDB54|nr:hypothetical protein [Paraflavitalea speifideiaquila]